MLQYFGEFEYYYAHDPEKICKTGDMVLIQHLPQKLTRLITHKVLEVVYPCGDVTDPLTGEKVIVGKYRYVTPPLYICVNLIQVQWSYHETSAGVCLLSDEKLILRT